MPKVGKTAIKTIDIFNKDEIEYWSKILNCDHKDVYAAIFTVGKSVKNVKSFIKASKVK